ncbi:MAG: histidine kinase [Bacteroidota bacterium]
MRYKSLSVRNFFIGYCLLWLLWMGIHFIILINNDFTIFTAGTDSVVSNISLFVFCLIISNILRYYQPGRNGTQYLFIWCLVLASIWLLLVRFLIPQLLGSDVSFIKFFNATLLLRYAIAILLIGGTILLIWVWQSIRNQHRESRMHFQAQQLAKEAELNNLRQQLQPHFLFNSLNSISALAGSQPQQARQMIQQLSDFLRGTLNIDKNKRMTLSDEINHLKLYLDIEKVRFGHRLDTVFDIEETSSGFLMPALLLQPIVENAIKFGLYNTTGQVTISIKTALQQSNLVIEVRNPFDAGQEPLAKGTGFGLSSLKRRLFLIFSRHDLLKTHTENNLFITTLILPPHHVESHTD